VSACACGFLALCGSRIHLKKQLTRKDPKYQEGLIPGFASCARASLSEVEGRPLRLPNRPANSASAEFLLYCTL